MTKSRRAESVYLVRHGTAEDSHALGDSARGLTPAGRVEFRKHATALVRHVQIIGIATSPLVRAAQTAELLAEALGLEEVRVFAALAYPGASARSIAALARDLGGGWAIVGHNPSMGEAIAQMVGVEGSGVRFREGAVAALTPPGPGTRLWDLVWLREPGRRARRSFDSNVSGG